VESLLKWENKKRKEIRDPRKYLKVYSGRNYSRIVGNEICYEEVEGVLIPIFLAQMSPFKSTKGLRGDKLPYLYSLNNWNIRFLKFFEFGSYLTSCSVSIPPDL